MKAKKREIHPPGKISCANYSILLAICQKGGV